MKIRKAKSEAIRLRHQYRRLILKGRKHIPLIAARRLVGPDCAFHLYARTGSHKPKAGDRK
ncbi:hypothetical protein ACFL4W_01390 [Planctomycetota bacterium]